MIELPLSGNVGLSLGCPAVMTSLSSEFTTFSKLVVCAMMICGRHRGLPYPLDRADLFPGERLVKDGRYEYPSLPKFPKINRYWTS